MKVAFVFPPAWAPWAPSYAMALFAGGLRREGHEFFGYDLNIDFYHEYGAGAEDLWRDDGVPQWNDQAFIDKVFQDHSRFLDRYIDRILARRPDILCLSVQSASTPFALALASRVRRRRPSLFILFGGPDCFPSEAGLSLLRHDCVDAICTGEGDEVLPLYLKALSENFMRPVEMKGFCHRRADGTIFDGGLPDPVMNLDGLAFADFSDVDFRRYTLNNRICMMTSRGCILRCAYCSEGANFLRYRYRSPESLADEVQQHVEMLRRVSGQRPHINFSDSLIDGRPEALTRFCELILERGIDFSWGGMALLRKEVTRELLELMRKAGFVEVMWGMESGSMATLRLMRKKLFDPDLAERIIRDTHELGIDQYTNIIVGFPGETEEQFAETTAFARRIRPYFRAIGLPMMEIRRNSHVYAAPDQYGVVDPDNTIEWRTKDGANTIDVRRRRREALSAIVAENLFDQGRY